MGSDYKLVLHLPKDPLLGRLAFSRQYPVAFVFKFDLYF